MDKVYENRRWEIETFDDGTVVGKLYFTQFYEEIEILAFQQNKNEPETFNYVSDLLRVELDYIFCNTVDEAIEEFENMIIEHIEDEISTLEDMKEKFNEERVY
jgi:hypothetical protein